MHHGKEIYQNLEARLSISATNAVGVIEIRLLVAMDFGIAHPEFGR
jgi:hypothetical protein